MLANAVPGPTLSYVQAGGTNASGVAYNPLFNVYYACIAGNPGFPYETFSAAGVPLAQTNTGFDFRGLWWNPLLNQVEGNGFNTLGMWTSNVNGAGSALNTGTNIFLGMNQPNVQSCGDFDYDNNEVIYYNNGLIHRYSRVTNAFLGSYPLLGMPVATASICWTSVVYTGCAGMEIGIEDFTNKRIYVFDKATGNYAGMCQLPPTAVTNNGFRFSYANGYVWLYDATVGIRRWSSYQIITGTTAQPVNLGPDTTICYGVSLTLDATTPGSTYLWQNASTDSVLTVSSSGIYWVQVTNGCGMVTDSISVTFSTPPSVYLGADTLLCDGDTLVLDAFNPTYSYTWQDASTDSVFSVTSPGVYWVEINENGCLNTDSISITYDTPQSLFLGNDTILCVGQSILLDGTTAGATYLWQSGFAGATFNVITSGTYWVKATRDCEILTDSITVTVVPQPIASLGPNQLICPGDSILLNAYIPGQTYSWQNASTDSVFLATSPGTYWVDASTLCMTRRDEIELYTVPNLTLDLGPDLQLCNGTSAILDATQPNVTYQWQNGATSALFPIGTAGTYWCDISNACYTVRDSIDVIYFSVPAPNLGGDLTLCDGTTVLLDVNEPGVTYAWQDGSSASSFLVTSPGNVSVTVSNGPCTGSDAIAVTYIPNPALNLGPDTAICDGESVAIDARTTGATGYFWNSGSQLAFHRVWAAGLYSVTVYIGNCSTTDSIRVIVNPIPDVNLGADTLLCEGDTFALADMHAGGSYEWQDGSLNAIQYISAEGKYKLFVTVDGCRANDEIEISYEKQPYNTMEDLVLCENQPWFVDVPDPSWDYRWSDGSSNSRFHIFEAGAYSLTATNYCGTGTDTFTVEYVDCNCYYYAPTAFSPDGDGKNEVFVPSLNCVYHEYELSVYNRWGQQVFRTDQQNTGWDGTMNGRSAAQGVYNWVMIYRTTPGTSSRESRSGYVVLLK